VHARHRKKARQHVSVGRRSACWPKLKKMRRNSFSHDDRENEEQWTKACLKKETKRRPLYTRESIRIRIRADPCYTVLACKIHPHLAATSLLFKVRSNLSSDDRKPNEWSMSVIALRARTLKGLLLLLILYFLVSIGKQSVSHNVTIALCLLCQRRPLICFSFYNNRSSSQRDRQHDE